MRGLLAQAIHDRFPDIILFNINTGKYCENSFKKLKNNLENIY
ncbi:unnamed protein product [marine sediment metagenome]|uniref:Uncharacterized protein n=1 Tax=marine sediment metagenome TaxID=412755 RepID=X1CD67_9ZZZZ